MKVAFVYFNSSRFKIEPGAFTRMAAQVKAAGHEVQVCDGFKLLEECRFPFSGPGIILFGDTNNKEAFDRVNRWFFNPELALVGMGGRYTSERRVEALVKNFSPHFIVNGYGEPVMQKLLEIGFNFHLWQDPYGVTSRRLENEVNTRLITVGREAMSGSDFSAYPYERIWQVGDFETAALPLFLGCAGDCYFCVKPQQEKIISLAPEKAAREYHYLREKGVSSFYVASPNFFVKAKVAAEMLTQITAETRKISSSQKPKFNLLARVDSLGKFLEKPEFRKIFEEFLATHEVEIGLGVENVDPEVLVALGKCKNTNYAQDHYLAHLERIFQFSNLRVCIAMIPFTPFSSASSVILNYLFLLDVLSRYENLSLAEEVFNYLEVSRDSQGFDAQTEYSQHLGWQHRPITDVAFGNIYDSATVLDMNRYEILGDKKGAERKTAMIKMMRVLLKSIYESRHDFKKYFEKVEVMSEEYLGRRLSYNLEVEGELK